MVTRRRLGIPGISDVDRLWRMKLWPRGTMTRRCAAFRRRTWDVFVVWLGYRRRQHSTFCVSALERWLAGTRFFVVTKLHEHKQLRHVNKQIVNLAGSFGYHESNKIVGYDFAVLLCIQTRRAALMKLEIENRITGNCVDRRRDVGCIHVGCKARTINYVSKKSCSFRAPDKQSENVISTVCTQLKLHWENALLTHSEHLLFGVMYSP